jgi:glycosyltransferase involved in cell wall biosynthesis
VAPVSARRSILLVARGAPPSPLPGARRIAGLSRYLEELGYEVTVLTSIMFGRGSEGWGASRVVRTRESLASPLLEQRRRWRSYIAGRGDRTDDSEKGTPAQPEMRVSRLTRWVPPDVAVATWLPFALPRALELASTHRPDCVITSAPPPSTHLIGLALHGRGFPWIADFRDGWTFEQPGRTPLVRPAAWLDSRMERLVATRAEVATTVTPRLTEDLQTRLNARATTITNGFDPSETVAPAEDSAGPFAPDRHSLLYTGSLYPARFAPFARALGAVLRDRPGLESQLEVVIAGPRWEGIADLAEKEGLEGVRWIPSLPRAEVLSLQRQADSLLVLLEPDRPGLVTTKLYEYLAGDRPVLVFGPDGDAARILADAGGGFWAPPTAEGLASGLDKLLAGDPPPAGRSGREAYTYPRIAARMAEQIETAIARRPHPEA